MSIGFTRTQEFSSNPRFEISRNFGIRMPLDYIPIASTISGTAHIIFASFAIAFISFAVIGDVFTFGQHSFTAKLTFFSLAEFTRGTFCFIPVLGNIFLLCLDGAQIAKSSLNRPTTIVFS